MPISERFQRNYDVDFVICIDKTVSMESKKEAILLNIKKLMEKTVATMKQTNRTISELRAKVIAFGDYATDELPMQISKFFTFPEETDSFKQYLSDMKFDGGGDPQENAIEALAHAIKSDWNQKSQYRRQIILLFTDEGALELGERTDFSKDDEPITMPKNFDELAEWWEQMDYRAHRLVLFVPKDCYQFERILLEWNYVWACPWDGDNPLDDTDAQAISEFLVSNCGS